MKISEKRLNTILAICIVAFIGVFSNLVLSRYVSEMPYFTESIETLDKNSERALAFTGAAVAASIVISFFPDDWASPVANEIVELSKYSILIMGIILFERLLVIDGLPIVFAYFIPFICILFAFYFMTHVRIIKSIASKLLVLAIAIVFVVPASTHFSDAVCEKYMCEVDETIEAANEGTEAIKEQTSGGDDSQSFFDKVSNTLKTAASGVQKAFDYFNNLLKNFVRSIAIMIIVTCAIPVITFVLFVWLLNQLFQFQNFPSFSKGLMPKKSNSETRTAEVD